MRTVPKKDIYGKCAICGMAMTMLASLLQVGCGKKMDGQVYAESVKVKEMVVGIGGLTADGLQVTI